MFGESAAASAANASSKNAWNERRAAACQSAQAAENDRRARLVVDIGHRFRDFSSRPANIQAPATQEGRRDRVTAFATRRAALSTAWHRARDALRVRVVFVRVRIVLRNPLRLRQ